MGHEYYDKQGNIIDRHKFGQLHNDWDYKIIRKTELDNDITISTVWLGLDHNYGDNGPPLIFETMVFGGDMDGEQWRYPTEDAAIRGHEVAVELVTQPLTERYEESKEALLKDAQDDN